MRMLGNVIRSFWRDKEGSALAEAALVVPVLFTLVLGVLEFGWFFYNQQRVTTGVRDAARYAAKAFSPCGSTTIATAQNLATYATTDGSGSRRVPGWNPTDVSVTCSSISNSGASPYHGGPTITIVTAS